MSATITIPGFTDRETLHLLFIRWLVDTGQIDGDTAPTWSRWVCKRCDEFLSLAEHRCPRCGRSWTDSVQF